MPSRINTDYWGTSDTWQWVDSTDRLKVIKLSQYCASDPFGYNQSELLNKGKYEDSVCIWGAPADCSIVSNTTVSIWGDGGALGVEVKEPKPRSVVPLSIQASPVSYTAIGYYLANVSYINSGMYNHRCSGDVTMQSITGQYNIGNATAHYHYFFNTKRSGATLDTQLGAQATYWDYRGFVYRPNITIRPKTKINMATSGLFICNNFDNGFGQNWSDLKTSYNLNDEDLMICGVSMTAHVGLKLNNTDQNRGTLNGWNPLFYASGAMQPSSRAKDLFYTTDTAEYGFLSCEYNNTIGFGGTAVASNQSRGGSSYTALPSSSAFWNNSTQFQDSKNCDEMFRISRKKQKFSDVDYHWSVGVQYSMTGDATNKAVFTDIFDGSFSSVGVNFAYFTMIPYLVIDDDKGYGYKQALQNAIAHEIAFYGFPICLTSAFADSEPWDSESEHILIPTFDEHMITTGEYVTLKQAFSQYMPQSVWHDIFGEQSIYDYDPEYNIPEPDTGENDIGDIENLGSARGIMPSGVNIYLMSRLEYSAFMSELNSYYANSTPDDWTLDFQGVNPSDYILNVYYTPYNFVKSENKSSIKIGQIELTSEAYELSEGQPGIDDPNKWKYFTYGTRKVTPKFYDFRDYDPFTKVELYLPLAGTIELDTNYVMNHDITIKYYFDLMTMSGVAAVYRDSMLYKTSDFKLGAQVPLLITNMGQIQNQITQLEFSQKQNNLRLATSAISSGVSVASIIAGGEASTAQTVGAAGGAFSLASGIIKADEIDYQLKHTSPSVSITGAAEPLNNYSVGQLTPKLIIKRPLMLNTINDSIYSKTIGNSCCINTTLDAMNGLVVCSAIDTTGIQKEISTGVYISPTIDEVNMIKSTFGSGVIL